MPRLQHSAPSRRQPTRQQQARRRRRKLQRALILVLAIVAMLGLAWLITGWIKPKADVLGDAPLPINGTDVSVSSIPTYAFVGPVHQLVEEMQLTLPTRKMMAVPQNGRIDMAYFNTVAFVGDSITQGLYEFPSAGIPKAHFMAYVGAGPKSIYDGSAQQRSDKHPLGAGEEVPFEALLAANPANVYILLGTNIMVNEERDDIIMMYYTELVQQLKLLLPVDVGIFVQSITSVREGIDSRFDINRIQSLNAQLAQMAWDEGVHFVDIGEALNREDGYLRDEYGADKDGYHLTPAGYTAWKEYLITHTVYSPSHAQLYLEGSNAQS